jgi:hypothetical protein
VRALTFVNFAYIERNVSSFDKKALSFFFDHLGRAKQTNGKEIAPDNVIK